MTSMPQGSQMVQKIMSADLTGRTEWVNEIHDRCSKLQAQSYEKNNSEKNVSALDEIPTCSSTTRKIQSPKNLCKKDDYSRSSSKKSKTRTQKIDKQRRVSSKSPHESNSHDKIHIDLEDGIVDDSDHSDISDISLETKISFSDRTKASIKKTSNDDEFNKKIQLAIDRQLEKKRYAKQAVKKDREKMKKKYKELSKNSSNLQKKDSLLTPDDLKNFVDTCVTSMLKEKIENTMMTSTSSSSKKVSSLNNETDNTVMKSLSSPKTLSSISDDQNKKNSSFIRTNDKGTNSFSSTNDKSVASLKSPSLNKATSPPLYDDQNGYDNHNSFIPYSRRDKYEDKAYGFGRDERKRFNNHNWYGPSRYQPNRDRNTYSYNSKYDKGPKSQTSEPIEYWGVIDLNDSRISFRTKNKGFIKKKLRFAIGPRFINDHEFNWPRYHGLLHYSFILIKEWNGLLGKRQIEKYLQDLIPSFESFLESKGYKRSMLLSQIKVHLKRKYYCIPYECKEYYGHYYNVTNTQPPTTDELKEDESISTSLSPSLIHFIDSFRHSYQYFNVEPPPYGAQYIPLQNETNDLQGTIISINSEKPAPPSFNDNEGFGHIPNESKKTGVSTFNHTAREQKKKDLLHISLIKPNFNWKKFNFSITEKTLEQYYDPPIPQYFRTQDDGYKAFQQYIYEDMMSDSEYESLTKVAFRYNKNVYLKTYAKTLNHFVTHLTKLHDPIDGL